jgi:CBS domain-containing protein
MKVAKIMTQEVYMANASDSVADIAQIMAMEDIGFMPVGEGDRLVGTITDRDIVVRGIAAGKDGRSAVREIMTQNVKYCYSDEDIDHVIENMGDVQVRRLPVLNRQKRLVGIVTLADAALKHDPEAVGSALTGVVEPATERM